MALDPLARLAEEATFMASLVPQIRGFVAQANPQSWDKPLLEDLLAVVDALMLRVDALRTDLAAEATNAP